MSTIEKNLRIDIMRRRMLDKNTLNVKGGLYYNTDGRPDLYGIYTVDILPPGENGLPLTSDTNYGLRYQKLQSYSFRDLTFPGSGLDPDVVLAEGEEQPDSLFEPHSIGPDHFSAGWGFSLDKFSHLVNPSKNSFTWNGLDLNIQHNDVSNQAGVLKLGSSNANAWCNEVSYADKSDKTPSGYIPTLWGSPQNFNGRKKTLHVLRWNYNVSFSEYTSSVTMPLPCPPDQVLGIVAEVRPNFGSYSGSWCYGTRIPFKPNDTIVSAIQWVGTHDNDGLFDEGMLIFNITTANNSITFARNVWKARRSVKGVDLNHVCILYYN